MTINGFNPNNPLLRGYSTTINLPVIYERRMPSALEVLPDPLPGPVSNIVGTLVSVALIMVTLYALCGAFG